MDDGDERDVGVGDERAGGGSAGGAAVVATPRNARASGGSTAEGFRSSGGVCECLAHGRAVLEAE